MADSLSDLIARGPSAAGQDDGDDDLGFIGMPKGFIAMADLPAPGTNASFAMAEHGGVATNRALPPRYKTGAELEPRSYSPENIAKLQQGLAAAGLIGPDTRFRLGVWDSASTSAYRQLLTYANQGGMDKLDALSELMSNPVVTPGKQARTFQTRTDVIEKQDPATLRAAAHAAFKEATGRGRAVNDKLVERFVQSFQAQQVAAQRSVNRAQDSAESAYRGRLDQADAGGDPGNGAISQEVQVTTPDMQSRAAEFAQAQDPAATVAHGMTKQFDVLLKMLGGIV